MMAFNMIIKSLNLVCLHVTSVVFVQYGTPEK